MLQRPPARAGSLLHSSGFTVLFERPHPPRAAADGAAAPAAPALLHLLPRSAPGGAPRALGAIHRCGAPAATPSASAAAVSARTAAERPSGGGAGGSRGGPDKSREEGGAPHDDGGGAGERAGGGGAGGGGGAAGGGAEARGGTGAPGRGGAAGGRRKGLLAGLRSRAPTMRCD